MKDITVQAELIFDLIKKQESIDSEIESLLAPIQDEINALKAQQKEYKEEEKQLRVDLGRQMKEVDAEPVDTDKYKVSASSRIKINYLDENSVIKYIKSNKRLTNKEYIRTKESIDKKVFSKYAEQKLAEGEDIDGVALEEAFNVSVKLK